MHLWKRSRKVPVLSPIEGYNLWAPSYGKVSNPIKTLSDQFIEKAMPDLERKSFLDCGCGTGKFCSMARKAGASFICGIDISPAMIKIAKANCQEAEYRCSDIAKLTLKKECYDVVLSALVIAHMQNVESVLIKLTETLKKGGHLIVTDFHPFLTAMNSKRTFKDERTGRLYEIRHYLHNLEAYFRVFDQLDMEVETFEEPQYNNQPAIFGVRARKK